jgi:hypothetical protein
MNGVAMIASNIPVKMTSAALRAESPACGGYCHFNGSGGRFVAIRQRWHFSRNQQHRLSWRNASAVIVMNTAASSMLHAGHMQSVTDARALGTHLLVC